MFPSLHAAGMIDEMDHSGDFRRSTFRWQTFGLTLATVTVVTVAAWSSWFPPFYMENDDVTLRMAFEGRTAPGESPTGFALMTHAALGWAVVTMHRMVPSISWWDVILAGTFLWALGVLVTLMWDALGSGWLSRATAIGALLVATVPLLASFQFTISATLAGGAAALLAIAELGTARPRRAVLAMAILLFLAGLLVRPMGGPAGAVVATVLSLPLLRFRRSALVSVLGILAIVGVLYLTTQYADGVLYGMSHEWNAYYRYNAIVGPLLEWGHDLSVQYSGEIRESVRWSANDWAMLAAALAVDPVVHAVDQVGRAYETQTAIVDRVGFLSWMLSRMAKAPIVSLQDLLSASAFVMIAWGALVSAYGRRRTMAEAAAVLVLFCVFCFAVEVTFAKLPWRLLGPLQVLFIVAAVVTISTSRRFASPLSGILALGIVLAMAVPIVSAAAREASDRRNRSKEVADEEVALERLSPSLVIFHSSTFPREYWWRPFSPPPAPLPAVALGWNNHNPQVQRFLTRTNRQPLLRALCSDPSMVIVAEMRTLDVISEYLREHFDTSVQWTQVYSGSFPAWRCSEFSRLHSEVR